MSFHLQCLLLLVAASTLWSTGGVLIKSVDWPPLGIAAARSFFAALSLILLNRRALASRRPDKAQLLIGALLAGISVTFIFATKLTTAANAIFLQYTAPIWVALLAPVLLGEPTRRLDWLFIGLVFCGMGMFFLDDVSTEGLAGITLAIGSGALYAALALALRRVGGADKTQGLVFGNILLACLGLWVFRPPWPTPHDLFLLATLGAVQFGLSYYLYALASRGVTALEMTLVTTLEPILNPVWVFIGTGERPAAWSLAGGALVLTAVTVWGFCKTRSARNLSRGSAQ
ncbi:MAG: DMT family transporter [Desulfovibrio sp.]|nr:DMT family transporter [Desulfovibrio sp.]